MTDPLVEKDEGAIKQLVVQDYIPGKPFRKLARELADGDLTNPAVNKLILSEIDKLEIEILELGKYRDQFYALDKENAVLKQENKGNKAFEVLYGFCISAGACIVGLSSWAIFAHDTWAPILGGGILFTCGILTKLLK